MVSEARDERGILRDEFVSQFNPLESDGIGGPEFEGVYPFGPIRSDIVIVRDQGTGEILPIRGADVGRAGERVVVPWEIENVGCEVVVVLVPIDVEKVEFGFGSNVGDQEFDLSDILSSGKVIASGQDVIVILIREEDIAVEGRDWIGCIECVSEGKFSEVAAAISVGVQR